MAAPEGNNYWNFRDKHGRSFKYTPESLWEEAVKYFDWMSERVWNKKESIKSGDMAGKTMDVPTSTPFSCDSFCLFADISGETFRNYQSNKEEYKDFFEVATRIRKIIDSQQFEGATVGVYNPNIIARTLGLADKTDITTKGKGINEKKDYSNLSDEELILMTKLEKKANS